MALPLWQLYDTHQRPLDKGGGRYDVAVHGLLHGAAHLWIWRRVGDGAELLLQQRAPGKINWPGLLDKSAGGHIFLHETPEEAALRKAKQELGLALTAADLHTVGVIRWHETLGDTGLVENEYQWVFTVEVDNPNLHLDGKDVAATHWKHLADFKADIRNPSRLAHYVPYGSEYYQKLFDALAQASK